MKAGFYEFEFTVAFIHDYLKKNEAKGQQAIVGMPTPMEEAHVGYDAKIATNGHVRFFQFKRPHYLQAGNGLQGEYYPDQPYYRINITPNEQSEQHNLIVNLAQSGAEGLLHRAQIPRQSTIGRTQECGPNNGAKHLGTNPRLANSTKRRQELHNIPA